MKIWKPSQAVAFATIVALSILSTTSAEQCSNDSSFEYRNDPAKDCNWVEKNKEVRCSQKWKGMELEHFCPVSCNICPDTQQCSDDPTLKYRNQEAKNCDWVGESATNRCALKWKRIKLSKYCPKACNACPVPGCEDDETIKFRNKAKRNCNWVSKKSTRCSFKWLGKTLREHCPEACNACHTNPPTKFPTPSPTNYPSGFPTLSPTNYPSEFPTLPPTNYPSGFPTLSPTHSPSGFPTVSTSEPSTIPSSGPTSEPTTQPPTDLPSKYPALSPTHSPSGFPTALPSHPPTGLPSLSPTNLPSGFPTALPSHPPTGLPSLSPTNLPSGSPTALPSNSSTGAPTTTFSPTGFPTQQPTFLD